MALFDRLCIVIKFERKKKLQNRFRANLFLFFIKADIYDDFNLMKQNDGVRGEWILLMMSNIYKLI